MTDYSRILTEAKEKATIGQHIINVHGEGFAVVDATFILDRLYFHDGRGKKMFFTFVETIK